ncbi:MAG: sigma-70 region 4 domain-containing protein [Chloroflexota bacterium]
MDELSTAEIAGVLGKSEGTVRVLIHRALRSVAKDLGADRVERGKQSGKPGRPT